MKKYDPFGKIRCKPDKDWKKPTPIEKLREENRQLREQIEQLEKQERFLLDVLSVIRAASNMKEGEKK